MRFYRALLVVFIALSTACASQPPESNDVPILAGPSAETGFEYGEIYNVSELGSGRIAFADSRERAVYTGFLDGGRFKTIGRVGSGPGEYQHPAYVHRLAHDRLVVVDIRLWRATRWSADGQFQAQSRIPPAHVIGLDSLGRMYGWELDPRMDSLPLLRWSLGADKVDTIGRLKATVFHRVDRQAGFQLIGVIYGYSPAAGVFHDGTVWVARDEPYRIDVMNATGRWVPGPARAYRPVPVTTRERRLVRDIWGQVEDSRGPDTHFTDVKAPFMEGTTAAGETIWLHRYTATDDSLPLYDLFDRNGRYIRAVRLPFGYRVVGFGAHNNLYAVRRAAGGRVQIARFHMPNGDR